VLQQLSDGGVAEGSFDGAFGFLTEKPLEGAVQTNHDSHATRPLSPAGGITWPGGENHCGRGGVAESEGAAGPHPTHQ